MDQRTRLLEVHYLSRLVMQPVLRESVVLFALLQVLAVQAVPAVTSTSRVAQSSYLWTRRQLARKEVILL